MKCPECGAENPESAQFCSECGKHLTELGSDSKVTSPAPSSKGRGINKVVLLIIVAIIVVGGAAAAFYFLPSFFSSPTTATVLVIPAVSGTATISANGTKQQVTVDFYTLGSGSGFIVDKKGYIVTAAHVVSDPYDMRYRNTTRKMEKSDIDWFVAQAALYLYLKQKNPSQLNELTQKDLDYLTNVAVASGTVKVTKSNYEIYIAGPAFPGSMDNKNYISQIVDYSATDNQGKDLALLKVDSPPANLPTLPISDQKPKTGDTIFIYGYPQEQIEFANYIASAGNQNQYLESMANATLTKGIVSGERTSPKGITYYQTDAAVNHGNSGGPVLNSNNQVIGVMVLGAGITGNYNFFLSSEYINELLKKNGLT